MTYHEFEQAYGNFEEGSEIGDAFGGLMIAARYLDDDKSERIIEIMKEVIRDDIIWRIENANDFVDDFKAIDPNWLDLLEPEWQEEYEKMSKKLKEEGLL